MVVNWPVYWSVRVMAIVVLQSDTLSDAGVVAFTLLESGEYVEHRLFLFARESIA